MFQISAKNGQTEVFQRIFVNQEIKNPKDQNGVTLLHQAAENGYKSICQLIVDNTEGFLDLRKSRPTARVGAITYIFALALVAKRKGQSRDRPRLKHMP